MTHVELLQSLVNSRAVNLVADYIAYGDLYIAVNVDMLEEALDRLHRAQREAFAETMNKATDLLSKPPSAAE
jgi:hypothetical protein